MTEPVLSLSKKCRSRPQARLLSVLCLFGATLLGGAAAAAEAALMVPIGYSDNYGYFAFEEFGISDGSGNAYSSIYMIDIAADRWVVGTPVRVVAETDAETLSAIRARVRAEADPRLIDLGINVPAHLLAANGDGDPDGDGTTLGFGLPAFGEPGIRDTAYELSLDQFPTGAGSPCEDWFGQKPVGFVLSLSATGVTKEVHRDGVLPRSRGCPEAYSIHSVYVPFQAADIANALVLVSVYAHGFEGLDRRFIALSLNPSATGD